MSRLAFAIVECSRVARWASEKALVNTQPAAGSGVSGFRRLLYLDLCRYDETPLPLTQKHKSTARSDGAMWERIGHAISDAASDHVHPAAVMALASRQLPTGQL